MSFKDALKRTLIKFGQNNSPTVIAMGIAMAKGIVRPTFTMMDKKERYETKRYTAIREGLTELIAIPVYYFSGVAGKKLATKLAVPKNYMSKKMRNKHLAGDTSPEVKNAFEHAKELAKINLPKVTASMTFIGVCLSALLIIPFLCSVTIKPIMKGIEKRNEKKKANITKETELVKLDAPKTPVNTFKGLYMRNNYGMKVGEL